MSGEVKIVDVEAPREILQSVVVGRERPVFADDDEPCLMIDIVLEVSERAQDVLEALVRHDPAHEEPGGLRIVESRHDRGVARTVESAQVEEQRQNTCRREAEVLEFLPVVFRVAESERGPIPERGKLEPSGGAVTRHRERVRRVPVGRRDVVVDQHQPVVDFLCQTRNRGADRVVQQHDVLGRGDIPILLEGPHFSGHAGIDQFHEDVGVVAGIPQRRADLHHLVADRVAVGGRNGQLMDRARFHARSSSASLSNIVSYLSSMTGQV